MKSFLRWLNIEIERASDRLGLTLFALMLYLLAVLILIGQAIPTFQGEANAACFQGTTAQSICSYPSARAKCYDLR